jgi:hypothetical protein
LRAAIHETENIWFRSDSRKLTQVLSNQALIMKALIMAHGHTTPFTVPFEDDDLGDLLTCEEKTTKKVLDSKR